MTVLEEVSEMSAAVSQMRETLLKIADPINQDLQLARPSNNGAGSGGRSHRGEISIVMKDPQGMETTWHQETLGGAYVCELSDAGHLCCGVVKRNT